MNYQRLTYIDNAKGFAILLVVIGHVIQMMYSPGSADQNVMWRYIYSFHMPFFMLLSGLVTVFTPHKALLIKKIGRRFVQLIIPFCSWGVVWTCTINNVPFHRIFITPDLSLWFLWALFFINLAYYIALYVCSKLKWLNKVVAVLLVYPFLMLASELANGALGTYFLVVFYPYFLIGVIIGQYKSMLLKWKFTESVSIVSGSLFVLLAYYWYRFPSCVPRDSARWVFVINDSKLIHFLIAMCGCIAVTGFFVRYGNRTIWPLTALGRITLPIYAIHQSLIWGMMTVATPDMKYFFKSVPGAFMCLAVILGGTLIIYKILEKNKYTSLLFLGK